MPTQRLTQQPLHSSVSTVQCFKCTACGKLTAGRRTRSDLNPLGYGCYPRRHRTVDGIICAGVHSPAEWVRVPASLVKTRIR